ncbi:hypothetical protein [Robbsia andropogonis]|uniref:hypothetical protein n=1 Tax=Robbsia andropogonis TaxID=28092 RepID=UPI0020A07422|nr:hypothetical protein [Robbsia andropogonis]MCP1116922.1 hypothetical protein [Robbsia andropogonis]MCP1126399.1 hypothetical protein [Robbsia andropogonis]
MHEIELARATAYALCEVSNSTLYQPLRRFVNVGQAKMKAHVLQHLTIIVGKTCFGAVVVHF